MRQLLKLIVSVSLITVLSSCATGGRQVVATKAKETPRAAYYPTTSLKRCPETLEFTKINVTKAQWQALDATQQQTLLNEQGRSWVIEYFKCAIRHNIGADVYEEQLRRNATPTTEDESVDEEEKDDEEDNGFLGLGIL